MKRWWMGSEDQTTDQTRNLGKSPHYLEKVSSNWKILGTYQKKQKKNFFQIINLSIDRISNLLIDLSDKFTIQWMSSTTNHSHSWRRNHYPATRVKLPKQRSNWLQQERSKPSWLIDEDSENYWENCIKISCDEYPLTV
jgi:hypothetical protein